MLFPFPGSEKPGEEKRKKDDFYLHISSLRVTVKKGEKRTEKKEGKRGFTT